MFLKFHQFLLSWLFLIISITTIKTETLQERLLKDINPCKLNQFRCSNLYCINGAKYCDGIGDCSDGSDERNCDVYRNNCPTDITFSCKRDSYYKCPPNYFWCNGHSDCANHEDEENCNDLIKTSLSASLMHRSKIFAHEWIHQLRRTNQPFRKWGTDVRRIAVALHLSDDAKFRKFSAFRDELANEISVNLLSRMALKKIEDISSTELALYINAFLATCVNPRNFFVVDLVQELRQRTHAQNITLPYIMLALCNAGEHMTERDVEKLTNFFWSSHRKFWIDMQALSLLALVCAARQPEASVDFDELGELSTKLKTNQYPNGTFETLKTTGLVMQALIASRTDFDENGFNTVEAVRQILLAQNEDGSFGSVVDTYTILPMLDFKSLADIDYSHCPHNSIEEEKEAISDLENQPGAKWTIQLSLWIGNNRTMERTLALRVPANISFEELMKVEEKFGKFRFVFTMRDKKPIIYSIYGVQNDSEEGMYWFLFLRSKDTKEHLEPISPADLIPKNNQHIVFWYKCGSWND